jgi:hypothetical protein
VYGRRGVYCGLLLPPVIITKGGLKVNINPFRAVYSKVWKLVLRQKEKGVSFLGTKKAQMSLRGGYTYE